MTGTLSRSVVASVFAVVALLALAGLTGCGQREPGAQPSPTMPSPTPSAPTPSATTPSASPHGSASPSGPASPTPDGKNTVELQGTVESGVESGCLILRVDGRTYNLVGGDRDVVKAGARVVVRGHEEPDLMTFCQQGVPFKVVEARPQ